MLECKSNLNFHSLFSVLTGTKTSALGAKFLNSQPNSIWQQMYKYHMTEESFVGTKNALKIMKKSNKLLALYTYLEGVLYHSEPCTLKVGIVEFHSVCNKLDIVLNPKEYTQNFLCMLQDGFI